MIDISTVTTFGSEGRVKYKFESGHDLWVNHDDLTWKLTSDVFIGLRESQNFGFKVKYNGFYKKRFGIFVYNNVVFNRSDVGHLTKLNMMIRRVAKYIKKYKDNINEIEYKNSKYRVNKAKKIVAIYLYGREYYLTTLYRIIINYSIYISEYYNVEDRIERITACDLADYVCNISNTGIIMKSIKSFKETLFYYDYDPLYRFSSDFDILKVNVCINNLILFNMLFYTLESINIFNKNSIVVAVGNRLVDVLLTTEVFQFFRNTMEDIKNKYDISYDDIPVKIVFIEDVIFNLGGSGGINL